MSLAEAVTGPDCTVESIVSVDVSAFRLRWMVVVVGGDRVFGLRCSGGRRFLEVCGGHVVVVIVDTWGGDVS